MPTATKKQKFQLWLEKHGACGPGVEAAEGHTFKSALDGLLRGRSARRRVWLSWLTDEMEISPRCTCYDCMTLAEVKKLRPVIMAKAAKLGLL